MQIASLMSPLMAWAEEARPVLSRAQYTGCYNQRFGRWRRHIDSAVCNQSQILQLLVAALQVFLHVIDGGLLSVSLQFFRQ